MNAPDNKRIAMKKQRYIVEIEMPDGDFISAEWLKDLIQKDCDVEDEGREKITVQVQETSLPSNLDEAAEKYSENILANNEDLQDAIEDAFKSGAEWMAVQGVKLHGRILPGAYGNLYIESDYFNRGYKGLNYKFSESNDVDMFVQIRKK